MQALAQRQEDAIKTAHKVSDQARSELQGQIKRNQDIQSKLCNLQTVYREQEITQTSVTHSLQKELKFLKRAFDEQKEKYESQMKHSAKEKEEAI